ncbi:MAG: glycosyltransferase family 39 protein [Lachnospiraceae bacterium]|nr:glycosyltransferase family 39 protein [Lachnospiraceae bacterium]
MDIMDNGNGRTNINRISDAVGLICFIIGAGVLFRTACFVLSEDIWFDELFTAQLASKPFGQMIELDSADVHPPLYYLIVRLVYIILHPLTGMSSVVASKIASIIPYVFTFAYLLTYVRKRFGLLAGGIAFLLMETMPHMSEYMVEARMYSWSAFVLLAMFIHAMEFLDEGRYRHMIFMLIYGIAGMYLHYYALIGAGIIAVGTTVISFVRGAGRKVRISLCVCMAIALIAYIPWIGAMSGQVGQVSASYWIQPVSVRTIAGSAKYIFMPQFENSILSYACAVVMILAYVFTVGRFIFIHARKKQFFECTYVAGSVMILILLVLAGIVASVIIRPVFVYRYMFPAMFIFWLGAAVSLAYNVTSDISRYGVRGVLWIAVIAVYIISCVRCFNLFRWEEARKNQGMKDFGTVIEEVQNEYPDTMVVCNFNQVQAIMWNYLDNDSILWGYTDETLIGDICDRSPMVMTEDIDELKSTVEAGGQDSFLFFGSGNAREEILDYWESNGMFTKMLQDSCFLERYYINIYEVRFER